jgi:hypothetical protein
MGRALLDPPVRATGTADRRRFVQDTVTAFGAVGLAQ